MGGEYYGKYDQTGQFKGPFANYLKERGIRTQYTIPGMPKHYILAQYMLWI